MLSSQRKKADVAANYDTLRVGFFVWFGFWGFFLVYLKGILTALFSSGSLRVAKLPFPSNIIMCQEKSEPPRLAEL